MHGISPRWDHVLARSPLQAAAWSNRRRRLCVLAYHGVDDSGSFEQQMRWLRLHAKPVSLADLERAAEGGRPLSPRSVLVTFDDGMRSVLEAGAPVLQEHAIPAVAFVVVGLLDTDDPYWWVEAEKRWQVGARSAAHGAQQDTAANLVRWLKSVPDTRRRSVLAELRARSPATLRQGQLRREELPLLEAAGVRVENHSWSHPCLDRCDDATIVSELRESHSTLSDVLGRPVRSFAYPNGNWNTRVRAAVAAQGCTTAFAFDHRTTSWPPPDLLAISRVRVSSDTSMERFRCLVSGLHPFLHRLRGRA